MLSKGKNEIAYRFKEDDWRIAEHCLRIMRQDPVISSQVDFDPHESSANKINQALKNLALSTEETNRKAQNLIAQSELDLVPLDEFSWLKRDKRAGYFVWLRLLNAPHNLDFFPHKTGSIDTYGKQLWHESMSLNLHPSDNQQRYAEIIRFFDRLNTTHGWKLDYIDQLKQDWSNVFTQRKPFPWLSEKNEEQCSWAWDYLASYHQKKDLTYRPNTLRVSPTSPEEQYLAIYAIYDSWIAPIESKAYFLNSFNKAWHQKKHRDSRQGKKACNLVLREDVKYKLDEMANARGLKLNQLVEALIESEYEQTFKPSSN
jgi:hypothetical protein